MQAPLPVDRWIPEIVARVRERRRLIVVAPPGAGKTTRIPPALAAHGKTILLQPRRVAARALARRIADEQNWTLGQEVGWQIRFERRFNSGTRLLVATEGILTARLQSDPLMSDFAFVVLDEFHERSIHADLALALVREAAASRDDLAVIVMSATIDPAPLQRFLDAEVVTVDARVHPVEIIYRPQWSAVDAIRAIAPAARGHLLCFLPGARDIEQVRSDLAAENVLPLHGSLPVEAQERAIAPSETRKIVLATNVAETSLTIDGVTDVIDGGLHKVLRFDPQTAIDHLRVERISRDSADQRAGRAGRTGPGRAIRLWDERLILRPQREPEVERVDLASALLDICVWGGDPLTFPWYERPAEERIDHALALLQRLDAIERNGKRVAATHSGRLLARFPLHPRLARLLADAGGSHLAARICALLSDEVRLAGGGDVVAVSEDVRLDRAARELSQIARRILGADFREDVEESGVRRAVLAGFPDRVALRRQPGSFRLFLSSGTGAVLSRETHIGAAEFLVALDVAGGEESVVRIASPIERAWLRPTHFDTVHALQNGKVRATRRAWYDSILLHEQPADPDPEEAARLLAGAIRGKVDPSLARRLAFARLTVDWDALIATTGGLHLPYEIQRRVDQLAPEYFTLPSGRRTPLEYRDDGSVTAAAKLQELFGLAETPRLGPDQVPVTFSLLAPNGRPVQITRDLRSFWSTAYLEVRKELRGRYPKHPWPEDPWTAQATHRTKRR